MNINLDDLSPDLAGEVLREICFTKDGFGCYSNFNLIDGFKPSNIIYKCDAVKDILFSEFEDSMSLARAYYHKKLDVFVFWLWDGDGTLGFVTKNRILYNTDCKKSYGWQESLV